MGKLLKSPKIFVTRQLKNFNKNAFIEALNRVYWDDLPDVDDPTTMVQLKTRVFVGILDRHAPVLMYQSIPSLTIPPGNFLMGEFPTPGQKRVQNPHPGPIKTS